jgi:hypothetical protein
MNTSAFLFYTSSLYTTVSQCTAVLFALLSLGVQQPRCMCIGFVYIGDKGYIGLSVWTPASCTQMSTGVQSLSAHAPLLWTWNYNINVFYIQIWFIYSIYVFIYWKYKEIVKIFYTKGSVAHIACYHSYLGDIWLNNFFLSRNLHLHTWAACPTRRGHEETSELSTRSLSVNVQIYGLPTWPPPNSRAMNKLPAQVYFKFGNLGPERW